MSLFKKIFSRIKELWKFRELALQLTQRDLMTRYKGSYLGFAWAIINPLIMLLVYSFIFSVVFKLKWDTGDDTSKALYTLMIFAGLVPFYIFSESINRSLGLISGSPNYVKKVVFPLEILPISLILSTLINNLFGLILLVIGKLIFMDTPNWTLIYIPMLLLPLTLLSLGLALAFSAIGTYIRDMTHTIALLMNVLFYASPIFYKVSAVPEGFRYFVNLNPLTQIIEEWRSVILLGQKVDYSVYFMTLLVALIVLLVGTSIFNYLRKGFSDVV